MSTGARVCSNYFSTSAFAYLLLSLLLFPPMFYSYHRYRYCCAATYSFVFTLNVSLSLSVLKLQAALLFPCRLRRRWCSALCMTSCKLKFEFYDTHKCVKRTTPCGKFIENYFLLLYSSAPLFFCAFLCLLNMYLFTHNVHHYYEVIFAILYHFWLNHMHFSLKNFSPRYRFFLYSQKNLLFSVSKYRVVSHIGSLI